MRAFLKIALVFSVLIGFSGCGVYMAAHQPAKKDISLFRVGTPRQALLAEYGLPTVAETRDGKKYEIYRFVDGYSDGTKAGRAIFHGAADVVTLGLWEIVATTTEASFDGNEMAYQVRYDENDRVDEVALLKKGT